MRYDAMFQPISIGGVVLKNRIAVAPMCTSWSTPDGEVTPRQCRYYGRLAQSGAGLVVAESFMVTEDARSGKIRNNIHHDRMIPAARRLAEAIHSGGAKACGISCVGVEFFGYAAPGELAQAGAVAVVKTPEELEDFLTGR